MQNRSGRKRCYALVSLALVVLLSIGIGGLSQEQTDWEEVIAGLRAHPSGPEAAELAQQAVFLYAGEDAPALLGQLAPDRVVVYCVDQECLRVVVLIPALTLRAGEGSAVYNRDGVLGMLGTFGGSIAPDLEGFFALVANPDGSVSLIDRSGEAAAVLIATQVFQVAVAPQPIPLPRPAESSQLPPEIAETQLEFGPLIVEIGLGEDHTVQIRLGQYARDGMFSGVILFGATPQPIPLP